MLAACRSYPERTSRALQDFRAGRFEDAHAAFADVDVTGSEFLSGAEAGMVALAAGNWTGAVSDLARAARANQSVEERALASPQNLGEDLLSFALNEGVQTYSGEGFERVMLHASLALAYLAQGRVDDVWVEARLANKLLESEEKLYEKEYAAGGLGHFVSAVTYELIGRPDEAYIDYARMVEKKVGLELAGPALVRIARRLAYTDDLERWSERFGDVATPDADAATIVVVGGLGLAPEKQEVLLQLPTPAGLIQWTVPSFTSRFDPVGSLILRSNGEAVVRTTVVEDVERVAHENLEDRIAWLGTKSAMRAALKFGVTRKLGQDHGVGGLIVGSVFTAVTERADLRSWLTLPGTWHAARAFVPPGEHDLVLDADGGASAALGRFELEPGETLFVLARTLETRVYAHVIGGRVLGEESLGAAPDPASEPTPNP